VKNHIGIVGGGQLGRMMAQEAQAMGFVVTVLDPTPNSPAGQVAFKQIVADYKDEAAIRELATFNDFMTFEIELANAEILRELAAGGVQINPSPDTLTIIKDKLTQKRFLSKYGIPVSDFQEVSNRADILRAGVEYGYPIMLKARFDAYDGRGNAAIKSAEEIDAAMEKLAGRQLYIEKWVPYVMELSVVAARSLDGEVATYPVVETIHQNNICHIVKAPAAISAESRQKAEQLAADVLLRLDGAGVFGIEMFLTAGGEVLVNEIAPRVHNSGHHTIEANETSQFGQHIRAITGLPLGSTRMVAPAAVMINILGDRQGLAEVSGLEEALAIPGVSVHVYGKLETKPERKMGHITALGDTLEEALEKAEKARHLIRI
jgi:5-(carboxyamino)imidazole ribonucleotide synthase